MEKLSIESDVGLRRRVVSWIEKTKKLLHNIGEILEMLLSGLMVIGILLAIAGFFLEGSTFQNILHEPGALMDYVERVFTIVIAIEFLQMLSRPNTDNVIEILIFLVARHMIVGESPPVQDLISIVGLTILILMRWVLHDIRRARERAEDERRMSAQKEMAEQSSHT